MIELLLTATIIWTTNSTSTSCVFTPNYAQACFVGATNTIYISKEITKQDKYQILYHEIGHSLYNNNFPKEVFQKWKLAPEVEEMADSFGWWMYAKKYPKNKGWVYEMLSKEQRKFFEDTCKSKCIKEILKIKTK